VHNHYSWLAPQQSSLELVGTTTTTHCIIITAGQHRNNDTQVTPEQYLAASPDPVAPFAGPVCGHMNAGKVYTFL
jgi:hypothetical protein